MPVPLLLALSLLAISGPRGSQDPPEWRDRRPRAPRAAWDALEGKPAPGLEGLTRWQQAEPLDWPALRGRVVLVGLLGAGRRRDRNVLAHLERLQQSRAGDGLVVLAVQSRDVLEPARDDAGDSVALVTAADQDGELAKGLAVKSVPSLFLVDRDGRVRIAGLNSSRSKDGAWFLDSAVDALLQEEWTGERAELRIALLETGAPDPTTDAASLPRLGLDGWPEHVAKSLYCRRDLRGKPAPAFEATHWLTDVAVLEERVVLVCFWSTVGTGWKDLQYMQAIHERFGDELTVVGLSEQAPDAFGVSAKHPWNTAVRDYFDAKPEITFAQALDGNKSMARAMRLKTVPYALVYDSRGIVRWQGVARDATDPLTDEVLARIVQMDAIARAEARVPTSLEGSVLSVSGVPARSAGVFFAEDRGLPPFSRVVPLAKRGALRLGPAIGDGQGRARLELGSTEVYGTMLSVRFWFRDETGAAWTSRALEL